MLEKIGLPPKPSLRGSAWAVDASNCQGCASQFTFINRKHHCRRCGGLFCNTCTRQRMLLRGQRDSPVRICEPCKKLEEAARYEKHLGLKNRNNRGSSSSTSRQEDEVLNQILGNNGASVSLGTGSNNVVSNREKASGSLSNSYSQEHSNQGKSGSSNDSNKLCETGPNDPNELRQQALEEKKKSKILKGEGKSEEALRALKRSKELERQAEGREKHLRRSGQKLHYSGDISLSQNKDDVRETNRKPNNSVTRTSKEKDDLASELRELGWTDMDLNDENRKSKSLSLEGELYSIISERSATGGVKGTHKIEKPQVNVLKKNALMLKREGKLEEAKEELQRAKNLEKQLEEQEILAAAEDSDDELSALIREMDNGKEERFDSFNKQGLSFDHLIGADADFALDTNFEVTDKDMYDPELDATLKSLGWTEGPNDVLPETPVDRETLLSEIQSLMREALHKKRAGNAAEAMELLKKAKVLERDFASSDSQGNNSEINNDIFAEKGETLESMVSEQNASGMKDMGHAMAPKSRLIIQKELLSLKKKALSLRREGRIKEADEELRKGTALELQLEEMDKASKMKAAGTREHSSGLDSVYETPDINSDLGEDDITDKDMSDPTYLSDLKDLGWTDDSELNDSSIEHSKQDHDQFVTSNVVSVVQTPSSFIHQASRKSKTEIQRELLGFKRKALTVRREGKIGDLEEVLKVAKELEAKMVEIDTTEKEAKIQDGKPVDKLDDSLAKSAVQEGSGSNIIDEDMREPALQSLRTNLDWKVEELKPVSRHKESSQVSIHSIGDSIVPESSSRISKTVRKSKGEIQRELLAMKREALALRRKGKLEEAEEILKTTKILEAQMDEFEASENEHALDAAENMKSVAHVNTIQATVVDQGSASCGIRQVGSIAEMSIASIINTSAAGNSTSTIDLLTGDYVMSSEILPQTEKELGSISAKLFHGHRSGHMKSMITPEQDQEYEESIRNPRKDADEIANTNRSNVVQELVSQEHSNIHQEVLAHKRNALALKREGKLVEAREELRQAKLLEKRMKDGSSKPGPDPIDVSSSTTNNLDSSHNVPKSLSSRDRFKLQQVSLAHKRQALKLRREGQTEAVDEEFELAKALETQLEELSAHRF